METARLAAARQGRLAALRPGLHNTRVENILNFTDSYYKATSSEGDQLEYLVPFPPEYNSTMKAYWTTDVVVLDPSCIWQTPMTARYVNESLPVINNESPIYEFTWDVTLAESNLTVSIPNDSFGMFLLSNIFMCLYDISVSESGNISGMGGVITGTVLTFVCENRSSDFKVPVDGSVIFVID